MARNKFLLRGFVFGLLAIAGIGWLLTAHGVSAQEFVEVGNVGLQEVQETSGLGNSSFGSIVGSILRAVLGILGIVTICIVIYGGFLYMTSSGNEESVDKAKRTLANGVIGLVIVLASYGITEFVIRSIGNATGTDVSGILGTTDTGGNIEGGTGGFLGGSSSGGLQVKSIIPKGQQAYANLQVVVSFTQNIDESSVKDHATVTDSAGAPVSGSWKVAGDSIVFVPSASCPDPHASRKCFQAGKEYTVTLIGGKAGIVTATSKKGLACSSSSCTAKFTAGDKIDVAGPNISNIDPRDNEKIPVDQVVPIQALLRDDVAIGYGRVEVDGVVIETLSPTTNRQEYLMATRKFHTKGDKVGKEYSITIVAQDLAGNEARTSYKVQSAPTSCFNKIKDGDEAGIDCSLAGGACGICANSKCTTSLECSNGSVCDKPKQMCIPSPVIKVVQPQDGAPGTFVTIGGVGFGTQFGDVFFLGDPTTDQDDVQAALACAGSWSDTQAVVQVPANAKSGPIALRNNAGSRDETDDEDGVSLSEFTVNNIQRPGLCTVTPTYGLSNATKVVVSGNDFLTNASLERKLFIGGYNVQANWGTDGAGTVSGIVPGLFPGLTKIQVIANNVTSNELDFFVEKPATNPVSGSGTGSGSGSSNTGTTGGNTSGNTSGSGSGTGGNNTSGSGMTATISSLSPQKGGVGQYVTISGTGFGSVPNRVYFVVLDANGKMTSDETLGDISFPQQCAKAFWNNTQTIVKVPDLAPGNYAVVVQPYGNVPQSTMKLFEITIDKPGPQICAIQPTSGPADGKVKITLYGDNFGDTAGGVIFGNKTVVLGNSAGSSWTRTSASIIVPTGVTTGEVRVTGAQATIGADTCQKNPTSCSNPVTYTVSDCRTSGANSCGTGTVCCGDGTCKTSCTATTEEPSKVKGVFAWCFSTGDSCDAIQPPRIVESCTTNSVSVPSPAPSNMWPSTKNSGACGNAMISLKFTEPVDPTTVDVTSGAASSLLVEECLNDDCSNVGEKPVAIDRVVVSGVVDDKTAGLFAVPSQLKPATRYRVSLKNSILGAETGMQLLPPSSPSSANTCPNGGGIAYCFYFETSTQQGACNVASVGITPSVYTADNLGPIIDPFSEFKELQMWLPLAFPSDSCQVLDPLSYAWTWTPTKSTETGFDFATPMSSSGARMSVFAKQPTASKGPTKITVTETRSQKSASSDVTVNLGAPLLAEACTIGGTRSPSPSAQWGGDVCYKAPVVVEFNQPVVYKNANGTDGAFQIKISECTGPDGDKKCESLSPNSPIETVMQEYDLAENRYTYQFNPTQPFAKNTTYLVEIPTATKSVGQYGKTMPQKQGCRAGVAHCFTFTTSESEDACKLKRVEVMPSVWKATEYGLQNTYNEAGDTVPQLWHAQGFGSNPCVWLPNDYSWSWSIDEKHATYATVGVALDQSVVGMGVAYLSSAPNQVVSAYKETEGEDRVSIQASAEGILGNSLMSIQFPNPTVVKYEPSACGAGSVCTNSGLGISFSTAMLSSSFAGNAKVYACTSDVCDSLESGKAMNLNASPINDSNRDFVLTPSASFAMNQKYRVVLTSGVQSTAYKSLVGMNYRAGTADVFSWTFTVTKDQCAVDRVAVNPVSPVARAEGEKRGFVATAYTSPDVCYPDGQMLNASALQWSWTTSDNKVADVLSVTTTFSQVFEMIGKGVVNEKSEQVATIGATVGTKTGSSDWKLQCNAPPATCPAGTWSGKDKCCHLPASVTETYPKSGDSNVCRNTLLTFDVNDLVDPATVSSSTISLGYAVSGPSECPGLITPDNYCYGAVPFDFTVVPFKTKDGDELTRVVVNLRGLLPAGKRAKLLIRPIETENPANGGVKTQRGVPVLGKTVLFGVGQALCELTNVEVFPKNTYFTSTSDSQQYSAYGLSKQGTTFLPISSIPSVYSWGWEWFSNDTQIAKISSGSSTDKPTATPGGANGQTSVTALAKITDDNAIKPSTVGKTVAGAGVVEAMLCEVPWIPETNATLKGILESQNMSFWYCRASNNKLLPSLVPVEDKLSDLSLNTIRSFRLIDGGNSGAIGFRIEKNLKQYSPYEWYLQREFKGEPERIQVDGFEAVRVGNTIYAGFANKTSSGSQYTNILVMSLSEPASDEMKEIFNQIAQNLQFLTNIVDVGLCTVDGQPVNKMCSTDAVCAGNVQTANNLTFGLKFTKDATGRYFGATCTQDNSGNYQIVWINPTTGAITPNVKMGISPNAGSVYIDTEQDAGRTFLNICKTSLPIGKCQKNQNISCVSNNNCGASGDVCVFPGVQECAVDQSKLRRDMIRVIDTTSMVRSVEKAKAFAQKYPIIATNSFIPGLTSSKWPSWESFMQQLGVEPIVDPLNLYVGCGPDSDASTCWSVKNKSYQCGVSSSVYHYRTINSGADYEIGVALEQSPSEQSKWQGDGWLDASKKISTNFCTGSVLTEAAVCGDGAVGPGEECDPAGSPVSGTDTAQCPAYGSFTATCSSSCKIEKLSCVNKCGDGIIQSPTEACDDGAKFNGKYNYCGADCQVSTTAGMCGDGVKQSNEACDVGTPNGRAFVGVAESPYVGVRCENNGALAYTPVTLDKNTGVLRRFTAIDTGALTQESNTAYKQQLPVLADSVCKTTEQIGQCSGYSVLSCITNAHCPNGSTCVKPVVGTKYSFNKDNSCNWNCKATGSYCGDGIVDTLNGEQCDGDVVDVNAAGKQCVRKCDKNTCTWPLVYNSQKQISESVCEEIGSTVAASPSCGDGLVNPSLGEECDAGAQNGTQCTPLYGAQNSCQYCTNSCKRGFVSGGFCGDSKLNGPEMCDGSEMPKLCDATQFDYHTFTCTNQCSVDQKSGGACQSCIATMNLLNSVAPNEPKTIRTNTPIIDPTFGEVPVPVGVTVKMSRSGEYLANERYFKLITPQSVTGVDITTNLSSIAFDNNNGCYAASRRYYVGGTHAYGEAVTDADRQVLKTLNSFTHGFQYNGGSVEFLAKSDFNNQTKQLVMQPSGPEGSYRVSIATSDNTVTVFPEVSISAIPKTVSSQYVSNIPNPGYLPNDPDKDKTYQIKFGGSQICNWSEPSTRPITDPISLYWHIITVSGCLTANPYAQLDAIYLTDGDGTDDGKVNGVVAGPKKSVLTLYAQNDGKFMVGGRKFTIRLNVASGVLPKDSEVRLYKKTGGSWSLHKTFRLISQISSPGVFAVVAFNGNDPSVLVNQNATLFEMK